MTGLLLCPDIIRSLALALSKVLDVSMSRKSCVRRTKAARGGDEDAGHAMRRRGGKWRAFRCARTPTRIPAIEASQHQVNMDWQNAFGSKTCLITHILLYYIYHERG